MKIRNDLIPRIRYLFHKLIFFQKLQSFNLDVSKLFETVIWQFYLRNYKAKKFCKKSNQAFSFLLQTFR